MLDEQFATNLMTHAIQEMGYLSDFLPELYGEETGQTDLPENTDQPEVSTTD